MYISFIFVKNTTAKAYILQIQSLSIGCATTAPFFKPVVEANMILKLATFEAFGHWPSDLSYGSGRKILTACDDCGKIRVVQNRHYYPLCISCSKKGIQISEITRQKQRDRRLGEKNPNFGKHHSEATCKKIGDANRGQKSPYFGKGFMRGKHHSEATLKKMSDVKKGKHPSEATREKLREARRHQKIHHTKPELIFEEMCKKYELPFKYTGDGAFWIQNLNPDFVECNGKKIAVEIFGVAFHSPLFTFRPNIPYSQTLEGRRRILKKYGWKLIVLWDRDLLRADAEQFVLSELKKYKAL